MHPRIFDRTHYIPAPSTDDYCGRCVIVGLLVAAIPSLALWALIWTAIRGAAFYLGVLAGLLP